MTAGPSKDGPRSRWSPLEVLDVAAAVGFAWALVVVHEYGHLWAGRAVGVPAGSIEVRLTSPPHVALRGPTGWVSPDQPEYVATFRGFNDSRWAALVFIAAGTVVAAVAAVTVAVALRAVGRSRGAAIVLVVSLALTGGYIVYDVLSTWRAGRPSGDFSAMWRVRPSATIALVVATVAVQVWVLIAHD